MPEKISSCLVCDRTKEEIPLIRLEYGNDFYFICSEHLPILIHHPEQLTERLPGADKLSGHQH